MENLLGEDLNVMIVAVPLFISVDFGDARSVAAI